MIEIIKPVRYGILIGLLGIVFGIGWAFWLVLGHERIHKSFEDRAVERKEAHSFIQLLEPDNVMAHTDIKTEQQEEHKHGQSSKNEDSHQHNEGMHDSPVIDLSHKRLTRGHLHAMGLGLVTIAISFILAFTSAPEKIKTVASFLTGLGGLIYPFAWIVMGYRTPNLGPAGAEASVTVIAGPGVALVALGIFTAGVFLLKDTFSKKQ
ncbi:MAG: hypothetical protein HZB80_02980 [Deltaproteobacteria bacterium]|nr:hypothetical protein [Deltaproteobacteria bacterium]